MTIIATKHKYFMSPHTKGLRRHQVFLGDRHLPGSLVGPKLVILRGTLPCRFNSILSGEIVDLTGQSHVGLTRMQNFEISHQHTVRKENLTFPGSSTPALQLSQFFLFCQSSLSFAIPPPISRLYFPAHISRHFDSPPKDMGFREGDENSSPSDYA